MNELDMIREKIDFFMEHKILIHIDLNDGTFLNGILIRKSRENVYVLKEKKFDEVFLFLRDIKRLNEFREVKENE